MGIMERVFRINNFAAGIEDKLSKKTYDNWHAERQPKGWGHWIQWDFILREFLCKLPKGINFAQQSYFLLRCMAVYHLVNWKISFCNSSLIQLFAACERCTRLTPPTVVIIVVNLVSSYSIAWAILASCTELSISSFTFIYLPGPIHFNSK